MLDALLLEIDRLTGIDFSGFIINVQTMFANAQVVFGNIQTFFSGLITSFTEGGFSGLFDGLLPQFQNLTGIDITPFIYSIIALLPIASEIAMCKVVALPPGIAGAFI